MAILFGRAKPFGLRHVISNNVALFGRAEPFGQLSRGLFEKHLGEVTLNLALPYRWR